MAASAKVVTLDNCTQNEDWTVVLRRRGKQRRRLPKVSAPAGEEQRWIPTELECNPERQSKLMQKMQTYLLKFESSQFFKKFLEQMRTPKNLDRFHCALGSESEMQMVIYGIGSIESHETARLQLSLAILIKRQFSWIGSVEVFDPILSATECQVLEALGCYVLSVNEHGRRQATKPTLFFMPHCEAELYNNLLQANWKAELLNRVVLFGNSFEVYEQASHLTCSHIVDSSKHILAARKFTSECLIETVSDDYFAAFHDSSWHFFRVNHESELQL